jgi:hypothetical protein
LSKARYPTLISAVTGMPGTARNCSGKLRYQQ